MDITRNDILDEAARYGASALLVTKFRTLVLDKFKTVSEFLRCDESAYRRRTRGVGKKIERLMAHVRKVFLDRQADERRRQTDAQKLAGWRKEWEAEFVKRCEELDFAVTCGELAGVVAMMEKNPSVGEIRIGKLKAIVEAVRTAAERP